MKIVRVRWDRAFRVISSIYPPIDLFEDISPPEDWELLASLESKSNPRIYEQIGKLSLVPTARRAAGPGASYVMAPFTHVSPNRDGRFHDGSFGAYYAANSIETALAEVMHHRAAIYRATNEKPGWFSQYRELIGRVDNDFHDVASYKNAAQILDANDYGISQALALTLRGSGSNGVIYPSLRNLGGKCLAAFWPDVIGVPVQGRHFGFHFNGMGIDYYRDVGSGITTKVFA